MSRPFDKDSVRIHSKDQFEKLTVEYAEEATQFIKDNMYPRFYLGSVKLDWSPKRRCDRGGWYAKGPGISMAMHNAFEVINPFYSYEYSSFNKDSDISGFYCWEAELQLKMRTVHEVAHAVQFFADKIMGVPIDTPHGPSFTSVYRSMRRELVNPLIPNQAEAKKHFEDHVKKVAKSCSDHYLKHITWGIPKNEAATIIRSASRPRS